MHIENASATTFAAWLRFTAAFPSKDKNHYHPVKTEVLDSWLRCNQAKVDPSDNHLHHHLETPALQAMLQDNQELIRIAKPFMENLYKIVAGSGFVVVLTDIRGYIMEVLGDEDTITNPITVSFFQGASWSEEEAGTNAIGTALVLKNPIQISGPEHYCRKHHCLTCSAAPIFDIEGNMLGVLNVSGKSASAHLHTLGMVVAAAEAIIAQLKIRKKNRELRLINSHLTNIFNTMSDGVILVDNNGIINELNPVAKKLLGTDLGKKEITQGIPVANILGAKHKFINKMLKCQESCPDIEIMLETSQGLSHCLASAEPVTDDQGSVSGGVIILRPIKQLQSLVNRFSGHYGTLQFSDIIGESKSILEAVRIASLASTSMANVLLRGESGTGKEIFAQSIHNRSERRTGPFIAVNCGAIPRELIGSELFGYDDGAFTGAKRGGKLGKFELASGGTLFLDEIGDMPLEQQVTLLRVLQDRKVTRLGSNQVLPIDVRVICATNKHLLQEIEKGAFRQDLYYRLNVISITIPPLRERPEDITPLFNYFLEKLDKRCRNLIVSSEVLKCIIQYDWPGNVRELQNVVERIVSLTEGQQVTLNNLPQEVCGFKANNQQLPFLIKHTVPTTDAPPGILQQQVENTVSPPPLCLRAQHRSFQEANERQEILALLSNHRGNVSLTARSLGVSRNTLYRKMKQYAIYN